MLLNTSSATARSFVGRLPIAIDDEMLSLPFFMRIPYFAIADRVWDLVRARERQAIPVNPPWRTQFLPKQIVIGYDYYRLLIILQ